MLKLALLSLLSGIFINKYFLSFLKKFGIRQHIRKEGPSSHLEKTGTPTMGGLAIISTIIIISIISYQYFSTDYYIALFSLISFGSIGFLDDFLKVKKGKNLGLTAKKKMIFIAFISLVVMGYMLGNQGNEQVHHLLKIFFIDNPILYFIFGLFVLSGTSNAVNLTDGLDGLASGCSAIAFAAFAYISFNTGNISIAYFCSIVSASCIAFLWFNHKPAQIFMGDTGSLALGGTLATVAILLHKEISLAIIGGLFVIEALSVIIQVTSFKLTGKRIFKMSPIHHHFELSGWSEIKIVLRFWIISIILALTGLAF